MIFITFGFPAQHVAPKEFLSMSTRKPFIQEVQVEGDQILI